jgi:excisionase family DNA binding protein
MVMSTENRQYLSTKDAAELLKVSQVRVRQFCQEGRIGQKVGDRYLILRDEVLQFLRKDRPVGRPTEN